MFKVSQKDTSTTPITPSSSVSIVNFEHVIADWLINRQKTKWFFDTVMQLI